VNYDDVSTDFCKWFRRLYALVVLSGMLVILGHTAHCQTYGGYTPPPNMQGHPQHADVVTLPTGGSYLVASGDSTGNVPTPPAPVPLGTTARQLKAEHDTRPKAKVVYVN